MTTKQLIADTLPSGWKIGKLKYFYKFETGFTPPTTRPEYYTPDGEMWVTIADMCNSEVTSSKNRISKLYADSIKAKKVPRGSLLYSFKLSLGKTSIAGCDTYTNEAIASFSSEKNPCINFLKYSSCMIEDNALENIYGAKLLNRERIENAIIVFPPIKTQERIAEYLDKRCSRIDECIKKLQAQLQLVSSYRQSLITRAVTKGLDPNVEMKASGVQWIGNMPSHWRICRVKNLFSVVCGATPSPNPQYWNGNINWIGPSDMDEIGDVSSGKRSITREGYESCGTTLVPQGSLVLSTRAPVGKVNIAKGELCTNQGCKSLVPLGSKNYTKYYYFVLQAAKDQLIQDSSGTTFLELSTSALSDELLPLPSLDEQKRIVSFLEKIDEMVLELKVKLSDSIRLLNEYRSSLISAAVTGQLAIDEEASA